MNVKNFLLGKPIRTNKNSDTHELESSDFFNKSVFVSNAVSSVAYTSEQIFITLLVVGVSMWNYSLLTALFISLCIAFICFLYIYIINIYPKNKNCYEIAKDNIKSPFFALLSSSAMLFDFIMTLSVSVSATVAVLYSIKPEFYSHASLLAVGIIFILMYLNLRGNKLKNVLIYIPVYAFILGILAVIISVIGKALSGEVTSFSESVLISDVKNFHAHFDKSFTFFQFLSVFILLKAFSKGLVSLTDIESIVEKADNFKVSSKINATKTILCMSLLLIIMFIGITWASAYLHIIPKPNETLLSQIFSHIFSKSYLWYIFQICTIAVLLLSANSCFAGFSKLIAIIAKDKYAPRQFRNLGDKLAYSNGIGIFAVLSVIIILAFKASLYALIPLYAIGVFITFSITLFSVNVYLKKIGNTTGSVLLQLGSLTVGLMVLIIIVAKFQEGAFIALLIIFLMMFAFYKVHQHYVELDEELRLSVDSYVEPVPAKTTAVILTSGIHKGVISAVSYGKSISKDARALYIDTDPEEAFFLRENWDKYSMGVPLVILDSPYRNIINPILQYLEEAKKERPGYIINVIIPEVIFAKYWHKFLHNKLAFVLRVILSFQKNVIVTHVSYDIKKER